MKPIFFSSIAQPQKADRNHYVSNVTDILLGSWKKGNIFLDAQERSELRLAL